MSAFTPERLAYLEAHRDDSRVHEIHWVYSIPIALATLSTALRVWAKTASRNGVTLDDWLIITATVCLVGQCASGLGYGPPHGMGRHVNAVQPHDLMMVRKGDYVFSHFYDIALVMVKLSILAFYHRIFAVPMFRKVVVATATFVIAWGIGITVTLALACRPIEAFWDSTIKGNCLELVTFTYFTNISNLVTDIWIFLMPWPVIWHLRMQTKRKVLLCFIFSIGLGTCVVSSVRLTVVLGHGDPDFTWYYVPLGAYSAFEPLGGLLCANLPIIFHMWRKRRRILTDSFHFKTQHTSTASPSSGASRRSRIARSLGLSNFSQSHGDSQTRTIIGDEENAWNDEMQQRAENPERARFFGKVEKVHTISVDEAPSESSTHGENLHTTISAVVPPPKSKAAEGMKKNVWEVRRQK